MINCKPIEESIEDSSSRLLGRMRKYGKPIAGGAATVGIASGAFLWHANNNNQKRYGMR